MEVNSIFHLYVLSILEKKDCRYSDYCLNECACICECNFWKPISVT